MIHRTLKDLAYLPAILLVVFSITLPAFAAPKISVDNLKHEFGEHWEDTRVTHDFIVQNLGDQDLVIEKVGTS